MKTIYVKKKIEQSTKETLYELIDNERFEEVKRILEEHTVKTIIGELDEGKQFAFFHHNFKYYQPTKESIKQYLETKIIIDEKDNILTPQEFWDLIETNRTKKTNHDTYALMSLEIRDMAMANEVELYFNKPWIKDYNPEFYEFFNDGLRFSSLG